MKNKLAVYILIISVLTALSSCSKLSIGSLYPTLSITSPSSAQSFAGGTAMHITGTATASGSDDAHLLHELSITITRVSDHSQVWMSDISVHDEESHKIDTSFVLPHTSVRDSFVLSAQVVNHLLNVATQKVGFNVNL